MKMILRLAFLFCCVTLVIAQPLGARTAPPQFKYRFLTTGPSATDYWPRFSPDGKHILFSRRATNSRTWELFVVPSPGGEARRLSAARLPLSATRANWHSKNNLIAFTGVTADGKASVWLINGDGTQPRQLAARGLSDNVFYPFWFPDGERLVVLDASVGDDRMLKRIYVKNQTAIPLTDCEQVLAGMPSVSLDGKWIAFAGQKNQGQLYDQRKNSIWLLGENGEPQPLEPNEPNQGRTPAWSPDGRLAFESDRDSPTRRYAVFVINRSGDGLRQITSAS